MSIDKDTVRKVASLARIEVSETDIEKVVPELSSILDWMEQLNEVDTKNVEPLAKIMDIEPAMRTDEITDGNIQDKVLSNAPEHTQGFFVVPKVVE